MDYLKSDMEKQSKSRLAFLLEKADAKIADYNKLLDSMQSCVFVIDDKKQVKYINRYGKMLLRKNNLTTPVFCDIFKNTSIAKTCTEAILGNTQLINEVIEIDNFKDITHVICSMYPYLEDGKITGWILVLGDYTDKYNKEQQKKRLEYLNSITHITSSIAHELKNPLGAISIHLQLIEKFTSTDYGSDAHHYDTKTSEKISSSIKIIEEEIDNMNNMIGLFLNNLQVPPSELLHQNLNNIVTTVQSFVNKDLEAHTIHFQTELDSRLPLALISPPSIIHVILNIIKNSIEAIEEQGSIVVRTYSKQGYVYVSIEDSGEGISDEVQKKIFNPYFSTKEKGSGIGLAIADKIMQIHNGKLVLDTHYKKGAKFILKFPQVANEHNLLEKKDDAVLQAQATNDFLA